MSSESPKPASDIEAIDPYKYTRAISVSDPSKQSLAKLDCNEASYAPSPLVRQRLIEFIEQHPLNWYPDTECQDLKKALSRYVGYPSDFISVFNGCDRALEALCRAYIDKGDEVVIFAPTYDNFRVFAEAAGGKVISVYAHSPFETNVKGLKNVLSARTKIVYLANPNNPTGVTYNRGEIIHILEEATDSLVIVDEAYFEFVGEASLALIRCYPNLVITRSFSKAFALAGLRCGYLVSDPRNVKVAEAVRNGKNVNAPAQVAAAASLEDLEYIHARIREIHETKRWFVSKMREMTIPVVDTPVNFVLIKVSWPEEVNQALEGEHVLVRNRDNLPQLQGYLRITIGTKSEMERVVAGIRKIERHLIFEERLLEALP